MRAFDGNSEPVRLGTHILVVPLRHPVLLAKELATLDHVSEGRFFFGVGPGWNEPELTAMGIPMKERGRRAESIAPGTVLHFKASAPAAAGVPVAPGNRRPQRGGRPGRAADAAFAPSHLAQPP